MPLAELHTEPSLVAHAASKRSLSYGEIASFAHVPTTMPTIDKAELKKTADYRIVGKTTSRFDIPAKTTGAAQFAIDVQVPNMVYATVLRSPVEEAVAEHVDDGAALAVPGVLKIVPLGPSVGVVAESVEAAFAARDKLKVIWSKAPADNYSSSDGLKDFLTRAGKPQDKGVSFFAVGDTDGAFAKAVKVVSAQYTTEYVYHAQMEPMNVTAAVSPSGDSAEIWIGTQGPSINTGAAAAMLKTNRQDQAQPTLSRRRLWPALARGYASRSAAARSGDATAREANLDTRTGCQIGKNAADDGASDRRSA